MAWADLHRRSADDYASTVRYFLSMGLEPPSAPGPRMSLADEFAEVDAKLRRLKVRREELRQAILDTGRAEIVGSDWAVVIEEKTSRRLDVDMLDERFGREVVDACRRVRSTTYLRTERL